MSMVNVPRKGTHSYRAPQANIRRSQFNRSHSVKTTFDASYLIPILVDEVLPGDTFTCKMDSIVRVFSPLDAPLMDDIEVEALFFYVPSRLVWDHWQEFNGAHTDDPGAQDIEYTIPRLSSGYTVPESSLAHYFGIPIGLQTGQVDVNVLPFRCYGLIWNEWFRDQNVQDFYQASGLATGDGPDVATAYPLKKTNKKHDYFTSALPYLQKGDAVSIPLTGNAPLIGIGMEDPSSDVTGPNSVVETAGGTNYSNYFRIDDQVGSNTLIVESDGSDNPLMYADLSSVTGVSVNALREALAIQRLLERDARGGTRYNELIRAHFGVDIGDARVQRPEFLGSGRGYINVSPIANQSSTATEDQGELKGTGVGRLRASFAKSFVEHGYVMGLIRARGQLSYFQGLDRMWSRSSRYDFYYPELAHLGEQAILNKEIYVSNSPSTDDAAFGYIPRWDEYRYKKSVITGKMDPNATGSLSFWHVAEDFGSLPTLGPTFLADNTPMDRVVTVTTEPDFIADIHFDYKCARPLPVQSIPSIMGGRF